MTGAIILSVLNEIEATKSRIEKEEILQRNITDPLMVKVIKAACDPFITYGLTPPKAIGCGRQSLSETSLVWAMLEALAKRDLTGNDARQVVQDWLVDILDEPSSQILWRILSKDLRCGVTAGTINRVLPGTIPVFDVMLAHKYADKRITSFPAVVEPKLDGLRMIGLIKGTSGGFFSRTGKPFPALSHLVEPVAEMLHNARLAIINREDGLDEKIREAYWKMLGGDAGACLAVDGEAISGNFNKTVGDVRRKSEEASDTVAHLFETLPYGIFTSDKTSIALKYTVRRKFAQFVTSHAAPGAPIKLVERYFVNSHEEIADYYNKFRARGLEGAIVKPTDGIYEKKRSYGWLKVKAEETEDLRVTGIFEGTGKYEGKLGGYIVDRAGVSVRVGGGISDAEREAWFNDPGLIVGHLTEIEYHEVTPDGSLRHPRHVRIRDDKDETLGSKPEALAAE